MIDEMEFIANIEKRYCEPCKKEGRCWGKNKCLICWVDDMMDEIEIAPKVGKWIPCSERMPDEDGEYLVWYDCGDDEKGYMIVPFDTEQGAFGYWQGRYHPVSLGFLDEEFIECQTAVAWMEPPEPYREDGV